MPIAAAAVLLVAIVISVATTRTIGRPLKHLARDMLSIADLDFQREGSVRDDVRNGSRRKSQMIAGDDGDDDSIHARMWSPFTYILSYIRWLMSIAGISVARRASSAIVNCDDNDESDEEDSVAFKIKELHHLRSAMKAMKNGLKSFAKYVPLDVVTLLMKLKREAVLGVDEMDLTIFFSDIANFTTIAESIPPQQLVEMIR